MLIMSDSQKNAILKKYKTYTVADTFLSVYIFTWPELSNYLLYAKKKTSLLLCKFILRKALYCYITTSPVKIPSACL